MRVCVSYYLHRDSGRLIGWRFLKLSLHEKGKRPFTLRYTQYTHVKRHSYTHTHTPTHHMRSRNSTLNHTPPQTHTNNNPPPPPSARIWSFIFKQGTLHSLYMRS